MSEQNNPPQGDGTERAVGAARGVDPKLLEILVCPLTKGPLRYDRERQELISGQALLEARDLGERAHILTTLMEMMAVEEQTGAEETIVQ